MRKDYKEVVKQMSLEEKAAMMSGKNVWQTVEYPEYGIPSMRMSDGPHGMRRQDGSSDHLGLNASVPATCFPTAATVANSWDEELGEEIGKALAEEAVTMGVHVILGPGLNVKRSPLCGRNFEYFSEDPYLSGKMAAAYIRGIQSKGIYACPKHFAANSQELRRMANNSVVDERTLREIYLTGFEMAVKEGKAGAIMSSYNEVNGVYANENPYLLQDILVKEWGFEGYVVSDWGASNNHALGVKHGSHLEMPGTKNVGKEEILKGIREGVLTEEELDERVNELLCAVYATQDAVKAGEGTPFDTEAHHALAGKAAEEGIVLLKNEDSVLPLRKEDKVLVIGEFAQKPRYQGAGSSLVNPVKEPEAALDVLKTSGFASVSFEQGYRRNHKPEEKRIQRAVEAAKAADVVLIFAGLDEVSETEGIDRVHMKMPEAQNRLIEALAEAHSKVVVILSAGGVVEMPWKNQVAAIVHGYLGGQAGASAMVNVLTGAKNPSGKLNESYPYRYEDTPAYLYYPGKERNSEYREGLFVGYRYYETAQKEVSFPFGFGLSYTQFVYSDLKATPEKVTFRIRNAGERDGAEIAQVYVGRNSDTVFRPVKELKGFKKVFLKAGEEALVEVLLDDKAFRFFDTRTNTWEIESGIYTIMVGPDSHEVSLQQEIEVIGTVEAGRYLRETYPSYYSGEVTDVPDAEFETLYGRKLPEGGWSGEIKVNDALCQFSYAKGKFARVLYRVLDALKNRAERKGKPDLNILFVYNMPIRGISRMTAGKVSMDMCEAIADIANGKGFSAWKQFLGGFFRKK